jgi:hypothetical protein
MSMARREMAKHKDFTVATNVQVYFCDPQSPVPVSCPCEFLTLARIPCKYPC